jgi:hypothetical protein
MCITKTAQARDCGAILILALFSDFGGYRSISPRLGVTTSVIKCEKKTMAFRQLAKFVADLNPGHCSLGAEGSNVLRVEVTP